jgi:hypothetical protein
MGYYIGKAKLSKSKSEKINYLLKGLCFAITAHGLCNFIFSVIPTPFSLIINVIILFSAFKFLYNKINIAILEAEINGNNIPIQRPHSSDNQSHPSQIIYPSLQGEIDNIIEELRD